MGVRLTEIQVVSFFMADVDPTAEKLYRLDLLKIIVYLNLLQRPPL